MTTGAAASFGAEASPMQMATLLALAFGLAATISLLLWCVAGQMLARLLRTERQWHMVNIAMALLLAASIAPMWLS